LPKPFSLLCNFPAKDTGSWRGWQDSAGAKFPKLQENEVQRARSERPWPRIK
jgi:hypothetical protein